MNSHLRRFWAFLKEDSWPSLVVSIVLIVFFIQFFFFPILSFVTGSPLPLVVVESCSMYHEASFDEWWDRNGLWYDANDITKAEFDDFRFSGGMNKGDIIFVLGHKAPEVGDVIIFAAPTKHPLIHRVVDTSPLATKGDHNSDQLSIERDINPDAVIGRSVVRIPLIGWVKLIFFEPFQPVENRGFC